MRCLSQQDDFPSLLPVCGSFYPNYLHRKDLWKNWPKSRSCEVWSPIRAHSHAIHLLLLCESGLCFVFNESACHLILQKCNDKWSCFPRGHDWPLLLLFRLGFHWSLLGDSANVCRQMRSQYWVSGLGVLDLESSRCPLFLYGNCVQPWTHNWNMQQIALDECLGLVGIWHLHFDGKLLRTGNYGCTDDYEEYWPPHFHVPSRIFICLRHFGREQCRCEEAEASHAILQSQFCRGMCHYARLDDSALLCRETNLVHVYRLRRCQGLTCLGMASPSRLHVL